MFEKDPDGQADEEKTPERVETASEAGPEMATSVEAERAQDGSREPDGEEGEEKWRAEHREHDAGRECVDTRRKGEREQSADPERITLSPGGVGRQGLPTGQRLPKHLHAHGGEQSAGDEVAEAARNGAEPGADGPTKKGHESLEAAEQERHEERVLGQHARGHEPARCRDRHRVESEPDSEEEERREGHWGGGTMSLNTAEGNGEKERPARGKWVIFFAPPCEVAIAGGTVSERREELESGGAPNETSEALRAPAESQREAVLWARGLTKVYQMGEVEVHALRGVDFALHRGELLVLLGASGSGKSTLLNIVGGLDVPSSGQVFYAGQDLSQADDKELTNFRRRNIGFVFQFYNLIPSLTAAENVALVTDIADESLHPRDALALVGLAERADHFPSQLSGGEQQRVAIARAIAKQPKILLCDEPTGALDYRTGIAVLEVLERINREFGTATAVITHNAPVAEMADRVVSLADGRIISDQRNPLRRSPKDLAW